MEPLALPDLFTIDYHWPLDDLQSLTPLQLCLTPFHPDYNDETFPLVQSAFFEKQARFRDRRRIAQRCFAPLTQLLYQLKWDGIHLPLCSEVASRLLQEHRSWRALGGFRTWTEYSEAAQNWGLVFLSADNASGDGSRIAVVEGMNGPLLYPLSWTNHDLPLDWRFDPFCDYLSPNEVLNLSNSHLVSLGILSPNEELAEFAYATFTRRWHRQYPRETCGCEECAPVGGDVQLGAEPEASCSAPPTQPPWPSPSPQPFLMLHSTPPSRAHQHQQPRPPAPQATIDPRRPNPRSLYCPPAAPPPPLPQPTTPPRTPPRHINSSVPFQPAQLQPPPALAGWSNPQPSAETSKPLETSRLGFLKLTTNSSLLPSHVTRQLRVLRAHYASADPSLSFLPSHLLPDAAVQRRSDGDSLSRVVDFAYATLDKAMLALQDVSSAEAVERVEFVDTEEGGWAWKDVLAVSEWGQAAWEVMGGERKRGRGETGEREAREGSKAKRVKGL